MHQPAFPPQKQASETQEHENEQAEFELKSVVDDELAIVRLCEQILSHASYKVCSAGNPAAALDLLAKSKFELLLVDIRMPLMDGFELARRAKLIYPELATLAVYPDAV